MHAMLFGNETVEALSYCKAPRSFPLLNYSCACDTEKTGMIPPVVVLVQQLCSSENLLTIAN